MSKQKQKRKRKRKRKQTYPSEVVLEEWRRFHIPKRRGGYRVIHAPSPKLKEELRKDLPLFWRTFRVSPFAHAFHPHRNIATMALPHVGKRYVAVVDIRDFFPSISLAYFHRHARLKDGQEFPPERVLVRHFLPIPLKLKPSESEESSSEEKRLMERVMERWFGLEAWMFDLRLPQGGPASPFLSNAYLYRLDWILARRAYYVNADYTRYADDLVFSAGKKSACRWLIRQAIITLQEFNLTINTRKTRIMGPGARHLVCGVVVNEKLNLPREWRRRLRAELHQSRPELSPQTKGRLAFAKMILENEKESWSSKEVIHAMEVAKALEE